VVRACIGSSGTKEDCANDQADFCADMLQGTDFDRDLAQECINSVGDAYSDTEMTTEERSNVVLVEDGPCADLLASGNPTGGEGGASGDGRPTPKAAGARCDPHADICVDVAYCDPAVDVCVLKAAEGEFCCTLNPQFLAPACESGQPEVPCTPGTFCSEGFCVSLGQTDDPCATDAQCGPDYFCSPADTCQPLGMDSDTCETDDQCASGFFCSESFDQCRDFVMLGSQEFCRYLGA
jgi:hypothetical protein